MKIPTFKKSIKKIQHNSICFQYINIALRHIVVLSFKQEHIQQLS